MAKFIPGAVISDIRNKLGGVVFTKSRYGNTIRKRLKPTNPKTTLQRTVRGSFKTNSQGWDTLTATQQAAWISWAATNAFTDKFGGSKALSANAAFVRYNQLRASVGLAQATTTPTALGTYPPTPTAAAAASGAGTVTLTTPAQSATSGWYVIRSTPGLRTGQNYAGSKLRIAGIVAGTAAATTAVVTPTTKNAKLAFTSGAKVILSVAQVDVNGLIANVTTWTVTAT
jgi:hypothetical protein